MIKTFFKILSLGSQYKYWMILAALMGFFTVGSGIGLMMTSSYLIASAAIQTPIYQLQVAIVGVRFFGISRGVFRYLERYISHEVTFKLLSKLRVWFFKSLEPIVPSKKFDFTTGNLLSRSIEDIENLEHIFVRVISPPFIFVTTAILMFTLLSIFQIKYSVIFLVMFIGSAVGIPLLTYLLSKNLGEKIVSLKSQLKDIAVDSLQGLPELLVYDKQESWREEFNEIQNKLLNTEYKMNLIQGLHESLTGLSMNLTVLILLYASIPDVTAGILNGVYLSVISIGIMASFEIVFQIPLAFQYLNKSIESAKRLFEITEQKITEGQTAFNYVDDFKNYDLRVDNISFSYDEKKDSIKNVTFELKQNQIIAIVGSSGAGKSTIVNLLTKLWQYDNGDIYIGNVSYKNISAEKIREIISVVPQKVHLFTGTIKENLLISKDNATDEELYHALKQAQLLDFVESLPDKLNTNIGELGKKLSGGESKRLILARALLRNSKILILDEITSQVDNITERKILESIAQLRSRYGIILITHRLVQMGMFDNILVLSNGKIVEIGSHKELLDKNGFYRKLYLMQNEKLVKEQLKSI